MVAYFKERSSLQIPALIFLLLILRLLLAPALQYWPAHPPQGVLFTDKLHNTLQQFRPFLIKLLNILLFALSLLYANYMVHLRKMFLQRQVLPAVGMLLFACLLPVLNQFHAGFFLLPLSIAMFGELTRLYTTPHPRSALINTGLVWGLGYLWYQPFLLMLPICLYGIAIMRPFRLVEYLLFLLGCITPIYFLLSYEYLTDQWHPLQHLVPQLSFERFRFFRGPYWWISASFTMLLFVMGINAWQVRTRRMVIQARKNWYLLLVMAMLLLPGLVWPAGNFATGLCMLCFPVGVFISNIFASENKSIFQLIIFWSSILVIALLNYMYSTGLMQPVP